MSALPEKNKEPYNLGPRVLWAVAYIVHQRVGCKEKILF